VVVAAAVGGNTVVVGELMDGVEALLQAVVQPLVVAVGVV